MFSNSFRFWARKRGPLNEQFSSGLSQLPSRGTIWGKFFFSDKFCFFLYPLPSLSIFWSLGKKVCQVGQNILYCGFAKKILLVNPTIRPIGLKDCVFLELICFIGCTTSPTASCFVGYAPLISLMRKKTVLAVQLSPKP